ncbi:MAG: PLP-dependent aminotransferase family protein [Acholeplasmatales bacterium]|nr:PLP-dependent aminotransferase family protein [Acholeplasmatales bacterium]
MDIILSGKKAKYIELYESVTKLINTGQLAPKEKLPSKRDLAISLNVSLNTVINAYDLLIDEGYIYSIEKKGYFVSDQLSINIKPKTVNVKIEKKESYKYDFTTKNVVEFTNTNYKRIIKSILNQKDFINKTEFEGDLGLRMAIASHLKTNRGINVSPNSIFIGSGIESLRSVLRIINIDNITFENPGYHKLLPIASNLGIKSNFINLDSNGVLVPNYKTILYTTSFSQFPTGIKMSISRKKELIDFLNKTGSYIIEDDFDAEFRIKDSPSTPLYSLSNNNVIFFSSFTMTMYPGIRISYFILPDDLKEKYLNHYKGYSSSVSTLEQLALKEFINSGYYASHINKLKKRYLNIRKKITDILDKYNIEYDDKKNYLSILVKTKSNSKTVKENLLDKGINISTLSDYEINHKDDRILIIGYTSIDEDLIEDGIKEIIKEII